MFVLICIPKVGGILHLWCFFGEAGLGAHQKKLCPVEFWKLNCGAKFCLTILEVVLN